MDGVLAALWSMCLTKLFWRIADSSKHQHNGFELNMSYYWQNQWTQKKTHTYTQSVQFAWAFIVIERLFHRKRDFNSCVCVQLTWLRPFLVDVELLRAEYLMNSWRKIAKFSRLQYFFTLNSGHLLNLIEIRHFGSRTFRQHFHSIAMLPGTNSKWPVIHTPIKY